MVDIYAGEGKVRVGSIVAEPEWGEEGVHMGDRVLEAMGD